MYSKVSSLAQITKTFVGGGLKITALYRKQYRTPMNNKQGFSGVMTRLAGRVRGVSKCRESGRVGSGQEVLKSRGSGRVGSGEEVLKFRGSGRVMTREILATRRSSHHDPRVIFGRPAGRTRGYGLRIRRFQTSSFLPEGAYCRVCAPRAGPADPTRGSENDVKLAASCTKASLIPGR